MALAESQHHTAPRRLKMARARKGGRERVAVHGEVLGDPPFLPPLLLPPSQLELLQLFEEEPGGVLPASLAEPLGLQIRRRTVEPIFETFVAVPSLDVPVLQSVDQPVDVQKILDISVPEQVIDVPKISCQSVCRSWWNSWWKCQQSLVCRRRWRFWHGDADGHTWSQAAGRKGTLHVQWAPRRDSPPAQGGIKYWARLRWCALTDSGCGRPCDHAAQIPAVLADRQ